MNSWHTPTTTPWTPHWWIPYHCDLKYVVLFVIDKQAGLMS